MDRLDLIEGGLLRLAPPRQKPDATPLDSAATQTAATSVP